MISVLLAILSAFFIVEFITVVSFAVSFCIYDNILCACIAPPCPDDLSKESYGRLPALSKDGRVAATAQVDDAACDSNSDAIDQSVLNDHINQFVRV